MTLEELEKIEEQLKNGVIDSDTAAKLVYNQSKKPWPTKQWRETRARLIKDYCEQCNSKEGPFVLQHTWHPKEYQDYIEEYILILAKSDRYSGFNTSVTQEEIEEYITENSVPRDSCPKCSSVNIRQVNNHEKSYICNRCRHRFDIPLVKAYVKSCRTENNIKSRLLIKKDIELSRRIWDENTEEIRKYAVLKNIEDHKRYLSCKDTVTFCKKCSYMWDIKGMKLCKSCGTHYHSFYYELCFSCSTSKNSLNNNQRNYDLLL